MINILSKLICAGLSNSWYGMSYTLYMYTYMYVTLHINTFQKFGKTVYIVNIRATHCILNEYFLYTYALLLGTEAAL